MNPKSMAVHLAGDLDTDHVFPSFHKFLVDHLARIVLAGLDMNRFLNDGIRSTSQSFPSAILYQVQQLDQDRNGHKLASNFGL